MPNYWVVGAMYNRRDDQFERFIRGGYWLLGWASEDQPDQTRRLHQISPGDRIAIKKRIAINRSAIQIRALGQVTAIDLENRRVNVRWVRSDLNYEIPSKGCFKSIHGPFSDDDEWTQMAFQLKRQPNLNSSELADVDDILDFGIEGGKSWRLHLVTERNRKVVDAKKAQVLSEKGSLECEVCGFDFAGVYRHLGVNFCEVHHKLPLARLESPVFPDLDDLAILCSNCHRIIHRTEPLMSPEDFRDQLLMWAEMDSPSRPSGMSKGAQARSGAKSNGV